MEVSADLEETFTLSAEGPFTSLRNFRRALNRNYDWELGRYGLNVYLICELCCEYRIYDYLRNNFSDVFIIEK